MSRTASTPTRVTADLAASAASVAPAENRTVTEQINHWARLGMQIERATSAEGRRVLAVVRGEEQFSTLTSPDRAIAHAAVDADLAERVSREQFGPAVRKTGETTVSLDPDGRLVEIAPDGSRREL